MKRRVYLHIAILILDCSLVFAGCAVPGPATKASSGGDGSVDGQQIAAAYDALKAKYTFTAAFATAPVEVKAGEPATLSFTVKNSKGQTVPDLAIVHEKPMHLLIVSEDLSEFYHIHPELQPDGSYQVTHTFPYGNKYKLYADFTPPDAMQTVARHDLLVTGSACSHISLIEDSKFVKTKDGLRVEMTSDKPLRAGEEVRLNFTATDAKSGNPATDLQPYLGALAHFVIISEDTADFLHAHPMDKTEEKTQMSFAFKEGNREVMPDVQAKATGGSGEPGAGMMIVSDSEVATLTTFPRTGRYKLWAQFQRNGQVITVPFVVRVAEGEKLAISNAANANEPLPADAIKVTVSSGGYEPSRISVKSGQPVRLAFYRADAQNCAGKVVFPSLGLERALPVGRTTLVEVTPQQKSEIAFTCGMSMYRGALIVK